MCLAQVTGVRARTSVDPEQQGFKHNLMKAHAVGNLTCVCATHESPYGRILSEWRPAGNLLTMEKTFAWDIEVPPNTTATMYVPKMPEKADRKQSGAGPGHRRAVGARRM